MTGDNFTYALRPWISEKPQSFDQPGIDFARFNIPYWQKWERMLRFSRDRDMIISVIQDISTHKAQPPEYSEDERRYLRYMVARLSALVGRFDQAVDYFGRARVTLERRDQRVLRAIVDYDEALARLWHRQPGADRLLALASARFQELGMREWSRRAAFLKVPDGELPDHLTARSACYDV